MPKKVAANDLFHMDYGQETMDIDDNDDGGDWQDEHESDAEGYVLTDNKDHSEWFKSVLGAIRKKAAVKLEELLVQPCTNRAEIETFADRLITTVGKAVCKKNVSKDLIASLEMLMYVVVEYGRPIDLVTSFSTVFERDFSSKGSPVPFFLPNLRVALQRLQKHRLFWLSMFLCQLDDYAIDFDWNGTVPDKYDDLIKLQECLCNFVEPFVESVAVACSQEHICLPKESASIQEERVVGMYRECLARSLLHLLSSPVAEFPVSYKKGFASLQKIVKLIGKIVPDFTVFVRWLEIPKENAGDISKVPINPETIATLAFLINCCEVQPNNFPRVLTAEYYLFDIVMPYSGSNGLRQMEQHLAFVSHLLERIPERSLEFEIVQPKLADHIGDDLLGQAKYIQDEQARKKIYFVVQKLCSRMTFDCLRQTVQEIWTKNLQSPTILEVLVTALRAELVNNLRGPDLLQKRQFLQVFKMFLSYQECESMTDACGLIASVLGSFVVALGMDRHNRSGVRDILHALEEYRIHWEIRLGREHDRMKMEHDRSKAENRADTDTGSSLGDVQKSFCWTSVIDLALDSLKRQIDAVGGLQMTL